MLDCLKEMEEYDPEGAKMAEQKVWEEFAETAGVTVDELKRAYSVLVYEGFNGSAGISEDSDELTLSRARAIVNSALDAVPTVTYTHPNHVFECEDPASCPHEDHEDPYQVEMIGEDRWFHEYPLTVESEDIKNDCFPKLRQIYGSVTAAA